MGANKRTANIGTWWMLGNVGMFAMLWVVPLVGGDWHDKLVAAPVLRTFRVKASLTHMWTQAHCKAGLDVGEHVEGACKMLHSMTQESDMWLASEAMCAYSQSTVVALAGSLSDRMCDFTWRLFVASRIMLTMMLFTMTFAFAAFTFLYYYLMVNPSNRKHRTWAITCVGMSCGCAMLGLFVYAIYGGDMAQLADNLRVAFPMMENFFTDGHAGAASFGWCFWWTVYQTVAGCLLMVLWKYCIYPTKEERQYEAMLQYLEDQGHELEPEGWFLQDEKVLAGVNQLLAAKAAGKFRNTPSAGQASWQAQQGW
mmetsp:Transcript_25482/g.61659  ORF Transcript_25482/g.61659 Transcript_25482/m.61659 type:complete len:311 (-) Transcript_25482:134-1066(-)